MRGAEILHLILRDGGNGEGFRNLRNLRMMTMMIPFLVHDSLALLRRLLLLLFVDPRGAAERREFIPRVKSNTYRAFRVHFSYFLHVRVSSSSSSDQRIYVYIF